jgi:putative oxidoreductase
MTLSIETSAGGIEGFAARHRDALLLLARFALGYIFIESGINHALNIPGFAATYKNFQLPAALGVPAAVFGVLIELVGGLALVLGYRVRETALLLTLFLLATILVGHRFWEFEGAARRMQVIHIKKNVAIAGGFLALLVAGAGRYAIYVRSRQY